MKKIISIMLTIIMCASCLVPVAFAETESQKFALTDFKGTDGKFEQYSTIYDENGMYGKRATEGENLGESSYRVDFAVLNNEKGQMLTQPFAPVAGSSIRITTKYAVDVDTVTAGAHLSLGLLVENNAVPADHVSTRFNPINGSVVPGESSYGTTVATNKTLYKTPVKTWVTYEMIYDIIEANGKKYVDKQSFYIDGQPVYTDHSILRIIDNKQIDASTVYGIFHGERKRGEDVHYADMSLTYYPEGFDESQIDANPWTASGLDSYFTAQADGSYILTDLSLTDEIIAQSAPTGWTFSRVSYNDATDGKIEYIRMDKGDATYFKKIISQDYISVIDAPYTGASADYRYYATGAGAGAVFRYTGVESNQALENSSLYSEIVSDVNPKSSDNEYLKLSYSSLAKELCGIMVTDVTGNRAPWTNAALTGRVAYEWSFMVPEFSTNPVACRLHFNGTPAASTENKVMVSGNIRWVPFNINDGVLSFNEDGTVTKLREPQTVLPGEWHRFTIIVDTNADTVDIYQNGIHIGTKSRFVSGGVEYSLKSINGIDLGINNQGGSDIVTVPHAIGLDDIRIGYVSADWTPETLAVTSNDESVTVNDVTSVIYGSVASDEDVASKLTVPTGCTAVYSNGTVKVTDSSNLVIRYYKVTNTEFALNGFDISTLTTDVGTKTLDVVVENNKEDVYNAVLILASYDTNGCLVALDISEQAKVYAKQVKTLTATIDVTAEEPVKTFKAFLWENTDSITPLKPSLTK